MPFKVPDFNLVANIFTVGASSNLLRVTTVCNLAIGRAVKIFGYPVSLATDFGSAEAWVGFPAGTDVRDASCGGKMDLLEIPAGSGRFYGALAVDDVGKGFANEYRLAICVKTWGIAGNTFNLTNPWPTPIP